MKIQLDTIPEAIRARVELQWNAIDQALIKTTSFWADYESLLQRHCIDLQSFWRHFTKVLVLSDFVAEQWAKKPEDLVSLIDSGDLFCDFDEKDWLRIFQPFNALEKSEDLDSRLRQLRQRMMTRFIWREVDTKKSLEKKLLELSEFADLGVRYAADFHYRQLVDEYGVPRSCVTGEAQPFLILGMGKLGAKELNLSSDIDLIFTFPDAGETQFLPEQSALHAYPKATLSNQEFFTKLGQRLIKSLDAQTAEGFVFRVDMRLRPHGQGGALVLNYLAMEDYYQSSGREWERYAMIKARTVAVVTGGNSYQPLHVISDLQKKNARQQLRRLLQPFTYRQYIDFSAIDSLREMKSLIARQVQKKSMQQDVKLGGGGIREVEFVVQVFQLIRGGRDHYLRQRQVMKLLPYLEAKRYLPEFAGKALLEAYIFLREIEHRLQAVQDRQTQILPASELEQIRIAWSMGFNSWNAFLAVLDAHRQRVNREFQAVIADPEKKETINQDLLDLCKDIWIFAADDQQLNRLTKLIGKLEWQEKISEEDLVQWQHQIKLLRESYALMNMHATSRERLDLFVPRLLVALVTHYHHEEVLVSLVEAFSRLSPLVESIARRSSYILLLLENPIALTHLVKLCSASVLIANQLSRYPALLDELLSPENLYALPSRQELHDELRREFLRITPDDLEAQMEVLRYFRAAHSLRVAASEVTGSLPLMKVSDYLSFLAEVILTQVLQLSWDYLIARHGSPQKQSVVNNSVAINSATNNSAANNSVVSHSFDTPVHPEFVIIAYGKLGGLELSHGSDLDLVFLHDTDSNLTTTGLGETHSGAIDNLSFYARLGQRIISLLNTQTQFGRLYEVDMRLRPSGNSGLLVSSLAAFEKYQKESAWTWEHQALVRARPVAGSEDLAQKFNAVRRTILCQKRDQQKLASDVRDMRRKMREQLSSESKGKLTNKAQFNLKQDVGGIVDIEFMVQYAALAWANTAPEIIQYTDNIRILGSLETAELLDAESTAQLIAAYKAYRSTGHRLALQQQEAVLADDHHFVTEREQVKNCWHKLLEFDAE